MFIEIEWTIHRNLVFIKIKLHLITSGNAFCSNFHKIRKSQEQKKNLMQLQRKLNFEYN